MFHAVAKSSRFFALAIVVSACSDGQSQHPLNEAQFTTAPIEQGDIRDIIPAVGEISAARRVEVGAEVSGTVIEVFADFDDAVQVGQVLARIDPSRYEEAVRQAEADLAIAQAAHREAIVVHDNARRAFERAETLRTRGFIAEAETRDAEDEVTRQELHVQQAAASMASANARLSDARLNLDKTEIRSPIEGYILDKLVEVGQSLNAVQSSPPMFVVASNLSEVTITARVSEADVGRIEDQMQVRFSVPAYPRSTFNGVAGTVRRSPQREGRYVTYPVAISAEDPAQRLLPGMTASVEFVGADARNVLRAPIEALYYMPEDFTPTIDPNILSEERAEELRERYPDPRHYRAALMGIDGGAMWLRGTRRIFVLRENQPVAVEIRVGAESEDFFEVISNEISPGEMAIVRDHL